MLHSNTWEISVLIVVELFLKVWAGLYCVSYSKPGLKKSKCHCEVCKLVHSGHSGLFTWFSTGASFIHPQELCPPSSVEIYHCWRARCLLNIPVLVSELFTGSCLFYWSHHNYTRPFINTASYAVFSDTDECSSAHFLGLFMTTAEPCMGLGGWVGEWEQELNAAARHGCAVSGSRWCHKNHEAVSC